ncbi:hypothetical protein DFH08DRAFT_961802 [Mycena albidolilacea]|uniref:Uncharacterized protein n=1 Tax=Mycena albidolilacea TaxID=1033008 RepID=A0AAD7A0F2_9AGAR|nr:hypothetical protein DFH08DRAFT_961802 [Mycena albidolilacea]
MPSNTNITCPDSILPPSRIANALLPQEIADIILGMVDAEDSLKACALVYRSLCAATPRILFRSLKLKGHGRLSNYTAASKLFGRSSHIGAYVKDMKIDLPVGAYSDANKAILTAVLAKLTAVRRCKIDGGTKYMWESLCDKALVAFLSWRPLQSLSLRAIKRIPLLVLAPFVASVPVLSFTYVTLQDNSSGAPPVTNPSSLTDLVLDKGTEDIITCLFSSSPARALPLQRLSVRDASCLPLIAAAAPTLRYLRIGSPVTKTDPLLSLESIPSLPSLRSFELEGDSDFADPAWVRDTITSILHCKP